MGRQRTELSIVAAIAVVASLTSIVASLPTFASEGLDGVFEPFLGAYGSLLYTFVGVVVLWRRPGHGIGRLARSIGLVFTAALIVVAVPWPVPLYELSRFLSGGLMIAAWVVGGSLLVVRFPSGHRTSRLGFVVQVALAVAVLAMIVDSFSEDLRAELGPSVDLEPLLGLVSITVFLGIVITYLGALVDLGLRYRRADAIRRVQMRWVLTAEAISVSLVILLAPFGDRVEALYILWLISMGLPVLAIAIAITRYHLYEIDRIISRSISYAAVTAVLFGAFAVTTIVLQRLVSSAVSPEGELEPWVVAASTLVVAALFSPARTRIQVVVDRRFNRERYDSAGIVAGFSGRLRGQLDLPTVSRELAATTAHALEPSTTAVWLRPRT